MAGVMSPLMASCVDVRGSPCWGLRCRVTRRGVKAVARLGLPQIIWVIQTCGHLHFFVFGRRSLCLTGTLQCGVFWSMSRPGSSDLATILEEAA